MPRQSWRFYRQQRSIRDGLDGEKEDGAHEGCLVPGSGLADPVADSDKEGFRCCRSAALHRRRWPC